MQCSRFRLGWLKLLTQLSGNALQTVWLEMDATEMAIYEFRIQSKGSRKMECIFRRSRFHFIKKINLRPGTRSHSYLICISAKGIQSQDRSSATAICPTAQQVKLHNCKNAGIFTQNGKLAKREPLLSMKWHKPNKSSSNTTTEWHSNCKSSALCFAVRLNRTLHRMRRWCITIHQLSHDQV